LSAKNAKDAKSAKPFIYVFDLLAFFAFLFRASCPSPFGPHFVRSKIFQKFLSRTIIFLWFIKEKGFLRLQE
jgi:hypothetical protein